MKSMTEYYTKAVVLERMPRGEEDDAVLLYTRDLGKITARAKSTRKPASKLSGHLNVGRMVGIRVIKTNIYKIVDAMSEAVPFGAGPLKFLDFINQMTAYEEPDRHLWHGIEHVLKNGLLADGTAIAPEKIYKRFLEIFGYGPKFAKCHNCDSGEISYFHVPMLAFLCLTSLKNLKINEEEAIKI